MAGESYEGWTNRETWLVNLWIDNDYGTYMAKVDLLKRRDIEDITPLFTKRTAQDLLPRGFYNDGGKIGQVNWSEVAESWQSELLDLLEHESQ